MLGINTNYKEQAQALIEQATKLTDAPTPDHQQIRLLQGRIEELFKEILKTKTDQPEAIQLLNRARNITTPNTAQDGIVRSSIKDRLYINTLCPLIPPTMRNSAYHNLQFPTVSTYHVIASPIAGYRLAPTCLPLLPSSLKKAVGDLDGRVVDLLSVTLDTRAVANGFAESHLGRPLNFNSHLWAYPDILLGNDVKLLFPMGLFPIFGVSSAQGVTKHKKPRPIALGSLQPLQVHAHARFSGKDKDKKPEYMLYSPDDAHFMIDPAAPFSATWAAVLDGDKRVLITRLMMVHNFEDPFMQAFVQASKNCQHLDAHLVKLKQAFEQTAQAIFDPLAKALLNGEQEEILKQFKALPAWHQTNIARHAGLIKDPTSKKPANFGKLAFLNSDKIDQTDRLSKEEQLKAFQGHLAELLHILYSDLAGLMNASGDIHGKLPKDVSTLMQLAQKYEDNDPSAAEEFAKLKPELQHKVFKAIWRLNDRQDKDFVKYGKKQFETCSPQERIKALYLAATALPFRKAELPKSIKLAQLTLEPKDEKEFKRLPVPKQHVVKTPPDSPISTKPSTSSTKPTPTSPPSPKKVGPHAKLAMVLDFLEPLSSLKDKERAEQLHALFDSLAIDKEKVKYELYKDLGRKAGRKDKAAFEYGRSHFGHNIELLRGVILERLAL